MSSVQWGTKRDGVFAFKKLLVTVRADTAHTITKDVSYSGRLSGVWNGSSPGQATFTLNSIQKEDKGLYLCKLVPDKIELTEIHDTVKLIVVGK